MSTLHHFPTFCGSFISAPPVRFSVLKSVTCCPAKLPPTYRQLRPHRPAMLIQSLVCPIIFALTVILHAQDPTRLPTLLPTIWPVTPHTLVEVKHRAVPNSLLTAFRLGRLMQQKETVSPEELSDQDFMAQAGGLLGTNISSIEELMNLEEHLENLAKRETILQRLGGAVSFVNAIWLVSIVGLFVTFWPTVRLLGGKFIRIASQWFIQNILPTLTRLHRLGVFEAFSYLSCLLIVAQASRYLSTMGPGAPGSYIALTAFAAAMLAFRYTMLLHIDYLFSPRNAMEGTDLRLKSLLWGGFQFAVLAPLAVVHQSELLGFCSIWSLLTVLGYVAGTIPSGYFVGFTSDKAMDRVAISCFLLVTSFVLVRLFGGTEAMSLKPFHLGVMVMGNFGYFLALLIRSSRYFADKGKFVIPQVHMIVSLAVALGAGKVFGIEAMSNTSATFAALYIFRNIADLASGRWAVVAWFVGFGLLYAAAAFLRIHPGFLQSMFDARGFLSSYK